MDVVRCVECISVVFAIVHVPHCMPCTYSWPLGFSLIIESHMFVFCILSSASPTSVHAVSVIASEPSRHAFHSPTAAVTSHRPPSLFSDQVFLREDLCCNFTRTFPSVMPRSQLVKQCICCRAVIIPPVCTTITVFMMTSRFTLRDPWRDRYSSLVNISLRCKQRHQTARSKKLASVKPYYKTGRLLAPRRFGDFITVSMLTRNQFVLIQLLLP